MNVFVLTTGRTGSTTFAKACSFIENFSSAHESRCGEIGDNRLKYPENHIEIDNRLCFYLGTLDKKYGNNAFYVHLIRKEIDVAKSINKRWSPKHHSIMRAFANNIKYLNCATLSSEQQLDLSIEYVKTTNDNIRHFLKDKTKTCLVRMEYFHEDFKCFWKLINAYGNLELALNMLTNKLNASPEESVETNKIKHEIMKDNQISIYINKLKNIFHQ